MSSIPIMRPKLPSADRLAPYLKSIDASRVYSNFGPLAVFLEDRLAEHYGLSQGTVATVANATLGLAIALAVQRPPHVHPATASFPRAATPVTDVLARSTLAVPFYRDIGAAENIAAP